MTRARSGGPNSAAEGFRVTTSLEEPRLEATKQAILDLLSESDRHVLWVSEKLHIRESAIRRHFDHLEAWGYAEGYYRQEGLGRPKKIYRISERGRREFPSRYATNIQSRLRAHVDAGRAKDIHEAIAAEAAQCVEDSRASIGQARSALAKARVLERLLNELGIGARTRIDGRAIIPEVSSSSILRAALSDQANGHGLEAVQARALRSVLERIGPWDAEVKPGTGFGGRNQATTFADGATTTGPIEQA